MDTEDKLELVKCELYFQHHHMHCIIIYLKC